MNYEKLYDDIILRAKNRIDTVGYFEIHHILPRCLGGSNSKENLVRLTAREHFLCHYLLYKMQEPSTPAYYKIAHAFRMMKAVPGSTERYFNARLYESAKQAFSEAMSQNQIGEKNSRHNSKWIYSIAERISITIAKDDPLPIGYTEGRILNFDKIFKICLTCNTEFISINAKYCSSTCRTMSAKTKQSCINRALKLKGISRSEETKRRISISRRNNPTPASGRKHSEESKQKMSAAHLGKKHTELTKQIMSADRIGKSHNAETKKKMSLARIGSNQKEETKRKISATLLAKRQKTETCETASNEA